MLRIRGTDVRSASNPALKVADFLCAVLETRDFAMKTSVIALVVLISSGFALPAFAVMQPIGSVGLLPTDTRAATMHSSLTVDIVALTARGNADVACRSVTVTFGDGSTFRIFRGVLAPDDQFKVYLPGGARNIQRMDFDCLSVDRGYAIVGVDANVIGP
jgi:hypothetical protein